MFRTIWLAESWPWEEGITLWRPFCFSICSSSASCSAGPSTIYRWSKMMKRQPRRRLSSIGRNTADASAGSGSESTTKSSAGAAKKRHWWDTIKMWWPIHFMAVLRTRMAPADIIRCLTLFRSRWNGSTQVRYSNIKFNISTLVGLVHFKFLLIIDKRTSFYMTSSRTQSGN